MYNINNNVVQESLTLQIKLSMVIFNKLFVREEEA